MKNPVLRDIETFIKDRLMDAYGFAGVASSDDFSMINSSDNEGNDIIIKIEVKPE